jgi:hypothetical protein
MPRTNVPSKLSAVNEAILGYLGLEDPFRRDQTGCFGRFSGVACRRSGLSKEWLVEGVACRRGGLSLQFDTEAVMTAIHL